MGHAEASTLSGASIAASNCVIVAGSLVPGTKMQSALRRPRRWSLYRRLPCA